MNFYNKTYFLVRILVFIMIGAVAVVFSDLFIFNKHRTHDPYWWKHNVFTTLAKWSSNQEVINVAALKSRHNSYMQDGIEIPQNALNNPPAFPKGDYKIKLARNEGWDDGNQITEQTLSQITPAAGETGQTEIKDIYTNNTNNNSPNLSPGIKEKTFAKIFTHPNPEEAIISYGEVPEYKTITHSEDGGNNPTKYSNAKNQTYTPPKVKGKIAIIIDDMGLSLRSKLVEILPGPLTLSYLPYANNLKEQTSRARKNGHELMVHVPMEPFDDNLNPGPQALSVSQSKEELLGSLDWGLSRFEGYSGINNHMGSRITSDKESMDYVMNELKLRGLFFIDSRTINSSVAAKSAQEAGIAYAVRDIFLDHEITPEFIQNAFKKLEKKALKRGYAIAIGHPHKETVNALKNWLPTLKEKGLTLVPASALLFRPSKKKVTQAKIEQKI